MDFIKTLSQLNNTKNAITGIVDNITQEQAEWKPSPDRWSVLEALNHLIDIEIEDFRYIINLTLFNPEKEWPRFNETEWITTRKYNERKINDSIKNFITERDRSLTRLHGLKNITVETSHSGNGFQGKKMRAGDILVSWIAHDLFHIRQLTLLHWDILNKWSKPYSPEYSGFFI